MKSSTQATQLRQAIRKLATQLPRSASTLALPQQPFDSLLQARSPLYRRSREKFLAQQGVLEPALLSSPRSLSGAILLENRIQYSPTEAELLWTAQDSRERAERLLELRTFTTSVFHEQSHRLLWPFLPPPTRGAESHRRYLNFIESLVVITDMALSDALGPTLARPLYLVGSIYDPGTTIRKSAKTKAAYRQYLLAAMHATYLNLELYDPADIDRIIGALFGRSALIARAARRALNLDRQFVQQTNPVWQHRNRKTVAQFFRKQERSTPASRGRLDLPDDPFQHGLSVFWAERWLDEMAIH
jgi:hypothetical protein